MNSTKIILGNATADGLPFQSWFMGDLVKWAATRTPLPDARFGLRQSRVVEMKWGEHRAGENRADWASCSDKTTISILLRGRFLLRFRSPEKRDEIVERRLEREGDYAIWGEDVEHTWVVEKDSVIITVRWIEDRNEP